MKLLILERIIERAKKYAAESIDYTHNHAGWEDEHAKQERIFRGVAVEYFIINFLRANGIDAKADTSTAKENDKYDFSWRGKTYDVKTAILPGIQITAPYQAKNIDFIICTQSNADATEVKIHGVASKAQAIKKENFIPHGALIPGTKYQNKFKDGVFYYAGPYEDFFDHFQLIDRSMPTDYWRRLWLKATGFLF